MFYVLQMKETKAKVIAQQREVTEYERKRLETMRQNAEFMKAKNDVGP